MKEIIAKIQNSLKILPHNNRNLVFCRVAPLTPGAVPGVRGGGWMDGGVIDIIYTDTFVIFV